MIKNIILDIVDVLVESRWHDFLAEKGFSESMTVRLAEATFLNADWRELDRGVMEYEDIIKAFTENDPAIEKEIRRAFADLHDFIAMFPYSIPWIKNLKKMGFRVYYLSNLSDKIYRECAEALAFMKYMDGGLMSYQIKLIKPDPAIYDYFLNHYRLKPGECIFIDNTKINVDAAGARGIKGIVFKNVDQAMSDINIICTKGVLQHG